MLPRCTPVTIVGANKRGIKFRLETGVEYTWVYEKYIKADHIQYFSQFFVPQCDDVSGLPEIDQEGIRAGKAFLGMSKQGVLYAMGIPPIHQTPSLDADLWTYFLNRARRTTVRFENGFVVEIR
ncbi:MAG: outer membrane protein assembly factor BamE [Myxococcales bacterium]|jgi:hypothetical protein|nr:outer membrane protein assembly factor BamE [Myxococcales bacterium]